MLGTLVGALEVRGIVLDQDAVTAEVEGTNEMREKIPVLTGIVVRYRVRIPAGTREKADRALATHQDKCPTANSLKAAVDIQWTADITEA